MISSLQILLYTILFVILILGITTLIFYLTKPSKRKLSKDKEEKEKA